MVLTILTQKFKYILNTEYHMEFSRYLSIRERNETLLCPQHKSARNYQTVTLCEQKIKEHCKNLTNEDIKSFCETTVARQTVTSGNGRTGVQVNEHTFNKQLVFSEHFNLFDFITSITRNVSMEQNHQFDFIVLDFKSISNATYDSIVSWRPLMILERNEIDGNAFIMHHALSEREDFDNWILKQDLLKWKCGIFCWGIIAATLFIIVSLIFIISLSTGIAAR
jgi:hypothetical protein